MVFKLIVWGGWGAILYTYVAFPIVLAALAANKRGRENHPLDRDFASVSWPNVALVVAAYNEENVIQDKLENCLSIDYPADRIRFYIGSDGSSDATNAILLSCSDSRLHATCFEQRRGKISVLNDLVASAEAEVIVFSDANTQLAIDSVKLLVQHFADPSIGCVSGELSYEQTGGGSDEGIYWKYENWIKRNESALGFLIGCNGGIFSLRRSLYEPPPTDTIVEDFVVSMKVLEHGSKVIIEPRARGVEPACASARLEMVRKIRIGAGNWQALRLNRGMLNPRHGLAAFAFWSHKVIRWLVPFFYLIALGALIPLLHERMYAGLFALNVAGVLFSCVASVPMVGNRLPKVLRAGAYFFMMNYALLVGFFRYMQGSQRVTWDRGR